MGAQLRIAGAVLALCCLSQAARAQSTHRRCCPPIDVWASRTRRRHYPAPRPASSPPRTSRAHRAPPCQDNAVASKPGVPDHQHRPAARTAPARRSTCAASARPLSSNTLILLNGRRLTDFDLSGFDFSTIPRDSIERIEITRGNSGAVLYGDGAVGGVINIVTKTGVGAAAIRARRGRLRLVQPARRPMHPRQLRRARSASRSSATASIRTAIARTTMCASAMRVGDLRYTGEDGQRLFQYLRRRPASRSAGRAACRCQRRHQRTVDRPTRRHHADRLCAARPASSLTARRHRARSAPGVELIVMAICGARISTVVFFNCSASTPIGRRHR